MPKVTALKVAIVQSGRSGVEIAESICRSPDEIYRWANDARPCPSHVQRLLAKELDKPVEELFPPVVEEQVAA